MLLHLEMSGSPQRQWHYSWDPKGGTWRMELRQERLYSAPTLAWQGERRAWDSSQNWMEAGKARLFIETRSREWAWWIPEVTEQEHRSRMEEQKTQEERSSDLTSPPEAGACLWLGMPAFQCAMWAHSHLKRTRDGLGPQGRGKNERQRNSWKSAATMEKWAKDRDM